jgi:hypothetical protein
LFINPAAIGRGMAIFKDISKIQRFSMIKSISFDSGIVMLYYEPKREPYKNNI